MEKEILLKEIENTNHLNDLYQLWNEFKAYLENQPSLLELGQLFGFNYHLQEKFNQLSQLFIQEKKYQESIEFHQDFINYFKDDKYLCPFYKNLALSYFYQDNDQGISYFQELLERYPYDYEIMDEDYREIIILQLLVADEVAEKHKNDIDTDHFLYATYHLNYKRNTANEVQRMYYMMEYLNKNPETFDDDIRSEYRDYYGDFTSKYGVTPTEYIAFLFWELYYYNSEGKGLLWSKCWENIDLIYKDIKEKEKISKVINVLKTEPIELKEWAKETETEEWDFTSFFTYPFLSDGGNEYISVSDITLINAFFEKIFWLIRDCYPEDDSGAMAFFGRLFERYIQDTTEDVCKDEYIYIDEFEFKVRRDTRKSSDAYIRKGKDLLVVEAKGFSVLVDCMAKNQRIENNNKKLFVKPVLQADACLNETIDKKEEFDGIEEAFIISVTLDNINAVPNYYNSIHKEISKNKKCKIVHYYYNFSIEEYEMLLYLIEKEIDIFSILREYFNGRVLAPFSNYVREKESIIDMTEFMNKVADKMKSMLWSEVENCRNSD